MPPDFLLLSRFEDSTHPPAAPTFMVLHLDKVPVDRARSLIVTACDAKRRSLTAALATFPSSSTQETLLSRRPSSTHVVLQMTAAESTNPHRIGETNAPIPCGTQYGMPTRIKPTFVENDLSSVEGGTKPLSRHSKQQLENAQTDSTPRLGISPTSVSLLSLHEGIDARTMLKVGAAADFSDPARMQSFQVPVWTGRISMGITITDFSTPRPRREAIDARMTITAPVGLTFDQSHALQGRFKCESFDQCSMALTQDLCWGKVVPVRESDIPALTKLARHLSDLNLVAVPPVYRSQHAYYLMNQHLDVRIVSKRQVLQAGGLRLPEWIRTGSSSRDGHDEEGNDELLCYWRPAERRTVDPCHHRPAAPVLPVPVAPPIHPRVVVVPTLVASS